MREPGLRELVGDDPRQRRESGIDERRGELLAADFDEEGSGFGHDGAEGLVRKPGAVEVDGCTGRGSSSLVYALVVRSFVFDSIGVVHSPYSERACAPRQAVVATDVGATIELFAGHGYEHALEGLEAWDYAWIVFVFHENIDAGRRWRPKVLPPRSATKRGVFATRSPHRPNPLGLSAVRIERVDGLLVHVRNVDLLDGTPVLDLKPYVAYADAYPQARAGWLDHTILCRHGRSSSAPWRAPRSTGSANGATIFESGIVAALALGPHPHPYRRIRVHGQGMRLALKDWRIDFELRDRRAIVCRLGTGYKRKELARAPDEDLEVERRRELHRAFVLRWGGA